MGDFGEDYAEEGAYPYGGGEAPAEAEDGGGTGVKERGVGEGEVFDAEMGGDLVVDDAVGDGGEETQEYDLGLLHGVFHKVPIVNRLRSRFAVFVGVLLFFWRGAGGAVYEVGPERGYKALEGVTRR